MADHAAMQITGSHQSWMAFLQTAARLYKYPYNEQVMIHAQRPNATACAEYDFWNEKMGRYVRRGSKGIALIDTTGDRPKLKYVFDVSDTGGRENSRLVNLWELHQEHTDSVTAMLERNYEVPGVDGLADQLERVAAQLADEYWNANQRDILDIVENSFMEEYDDFNVGVAFRNAATVSITYSLMSRCGLEPENYFEHEDFLSIFDFNTPATVAALGTAVSEINQRVLRQVEVTIKNYEREHSAERTEDNGRADLYAERGLPDSRPEPERDGAAVRQIREDAEDLSSGAAPRPLEQADSEREAVPAPAGDRAGGAEPLGADDVGTDESGGRDGEPESGRPDEVDRADEQPESAGGGNHPERADIQLNPVQLSLFPTEAEQIAQIDEAENARKASFAFSLSQEHLDMVLQSGSNKENSRLRIAAEFIKGKPVSEIADFLRQEYVGGKGFRTEPDDISVWFTNEGIRAYRFDTARYVNDAQLIQWEDAALRIGELLEQGRYMTNVELVEVDGYERTQLAQAIWYLRHDFDDGARELDLLPSLEPLNHGGYPEITDALAAKLAEPEFRATLVAEYEQYLEAYLQDPEIMRFHYHHPKELFDRLKDLDLPRREYSTDMMELPEHREFITEDEISEAITGGSHVEDGKFRIYSYFTENHTAKEKADFLKHEYGIGGHSHAVSHADNSHEDHSSKGIRFEKGDCAEVQLSWSNVAKRVDELIRKRRYLTPKEQARYLATVALNAVPSSYTEYAALKEQHPDDLVLYQIGHFYEIYDEDARAAASFLDTTTDFRTVPDGGNRMVFRVPDNQLTQYVNHLREQFDLTISRIDAQNRTRQVYSLPSIDHEAERAIDAHEAKYGADGSRAFPDNAPEAVSVPSFEDYSRIKRETQTGILLYQMGDFFEMYGEDAEIAAEALNINLTTRALSSSERTPMCGIPSYRLEQYVEKLQDAGHSVVISGKDEISGERRVFRLDRPTAPEVVKEPEQPAPLRPATQADIDAALQRWNGNIKSKQHTNTYISLHARDKETAAWLRNEFGGDRPTFPVRGEGIEPMELSWAKVQRSIAKMVQKDEFYTQEEHDNLDDIDTDYIRERLAESGIVNGELVDPDALDRNPFIQQMMADAERVAQENIAPVQLPTDDFLAAQEVNDDMRDVLMNGILPPGERETVFGMLREEKDNAEITAYLSGRFENSDAGTMEMETGETADYFTSIDGFEIVLHDSNNTQLGALWKDAAPMLRRIYENDLNAFMSRGEQPERFAVVETSDAFTEPYALYDTQANDYYIDDDGTVLTFEVYADARRLMNELNEPESVAAKNEWPFAVGDTVYLEDGKPFIVEILTDMHIQLRDPTLYYPIFRAESWESFERLMQRYPQPEKPAPEPDKPEMTSETVAFYPADKNNLPYDIVVERLHFDEPEHDPPPHTRTEIQPEPENFQITNDNLGAGGAKTKFRANMDAINLLKELELDGRQATPDEQEVLSKYVGWGGIADAFDENKPAWANEFRELYAALTPEEYAAARASTLNAHYTSPTVIKAIYEAVGNMGFETGNILEPAMGVGNFFGLLPDNMAGSKLYGVELDSITGRIAKQLYPKADITVAGFESTDRRDFFDLAIGNVPFGQYQVNDRAYNKLGFSIHDYFFAKSLDQVRPGGVVAFVTSRYTLDKQSPEVRKYIAQRVDFLGAIRLPNNAFRANAGTDVVSDIIFLQKRDRPIEIEPEWVHLGQNEDGFAINSYFIDHPEMILGRQTSESTQYGKQDFTVEPIEGLRLADQLHDAVKYIRGTYQEAEMPELGDGEEIDTSIPADPDVKNFSYTIRDGEVYYRENSRMVKPELNATAKERVKGMVELRDCVQTLIGQQMDGFISDTAIRRTQAELNDLYDSFTEKYGLINSRGNALAFADDNSYYLLCSLEVLDEEGNLDHKADMFTRRTIKPHEVVTSVDTASEALALSISERARVDIDYMSQLTGKDADTLASELRGVIFRLPEPVGSNGQPRYVAADEYLSGNVWEKLCVAEKAAEVSDVFRPNVEALRAAQPKDLDASEIEVRLGATWIDKEYIQEFMYELLDPPYYIRRNIEVNYSEFSAEWNITGKSSVGYNNINAFMTYGTERVNAYKILEDTLNLRDVRVYDTVTDPDGKERRVLNSKETTLAQQKQQAIKDAFQDWIWKDPDRRRELTQKYNELFNSTRPREYDGKHITFSGINPEIRLRDHQLNAVAHILYGGNTLLAHEVGAGKTFEMVAAAMESKRLGLCQKPLFAVPNHLTEQWASEFLRLYPSANILVATRKDFEARNRKKFCARIATGDYDAVIMGHSQFERIPVSLERQERLLQEQIWEIEDGLEELKNSRAERFTIKSLERTKKGLEARLKKLQDNTRKDDVITFEQLGVDRLYVDEAHSFKNLFLYTKMRNVAGLSTTDAQKSSDMLLKCRYIDEITNSKGIIFATGTPVSNSMTELYTMMRYLQHNTIQRKGLAHFDCWASTFGETQTAIELAPEGTGYRARTRFAKFFNLPELMTLFKEAADIKTADQLNLPTPTPVYHNVVAQPTEIQRGMVQELSERAAKVHAGIVEPNIDNMLKITSDGRKLGLDQRVINPDLPDEPTSKVNQCVDNIYRIWDEGQPEKLTQLLFCDLSTPKTGAAKKAAKAVAGNLDSPELHALEAMLDKDSEDNGPQFTIYNDIREKLVARGIPRDKIAFIHEANTETRKKELFAKVRTGQVRVLMGSTFKMGAGMNVQDRLVALHDLDAPWRPGDLEQRSGRIIRQGNKNKEVHIYRYVTEATFDAYLWQTLENKQKFISQIMTSKSPVRSCEDIDETALSYAEIKALCAGDERIKEKMDLDVDVARLKLMKSSHQSQQYKLEDNMLRYFPKEIEQCKGFIAGFKADKKTLAEHPHPTDGFAGMEIKGDVLTDKDNAGAAILEAFKDAKGMEPVPVGNYRGFAMSLTVEDFGRDFVLTLKGQMTHRVTLGKDARGNLTRIDNALNQMPERQKNTQERLDNLYAQMATAKAGIGKPFPQEDELRAKSARLAELNAELNIDDKTPLQRLAEPEIAKSARPSVLEQLKKPLPQAAQSKSKTREVEEL